jgi:hypothetical protein
MRSAAPLEQGHWTSIANKEGLPISPRSPTSASLPWPRRHSCAALAGVTDEKASAVAALAAYARHCGLPAFAPFLADSLDVAMRMALYFHEDVRIQAYETLGALCTLGGSGSVDSEMRWGLLARLCLQRLVVCVDG